MTAQKREVSLTEEQVKEVQEVLDSIRIYCNDAENIRWTELSEDGMLTAKFASHSTYDIVKTELLYAGYDALIIDHREDGEVELQIITTALRDRYEEAKAEATTKAAWARKYHKWWSDADDEISLLKSQMKQYLEIGGIDEYHSDPKVATIAQVIAKLLN